MNIHTFIYIHICIYIIIGQAAVARFSTRKVITLMKGRSVYFTPTISNAANSSIVAHCEKEIEDPITKTMITENAVWALQRQDTGGVLDNNWVKISDSSKADKWTTPICHSAGGGDSVLVVEDGWLVSRAISRFKRDKETGLLQSKKIMKVRGEVQFLMSPDNSRAVVIQEDISNGHYSVTVVEGEDALDPSHSSTGNQYVLPTPKLTVAFWFSPDSTKILCMNVAGRTKDEILFQRNSFRSLCESELQYTVFNFPLQEIREYDIFKPTPYFANSYIPFFSQYFQSYNPWAPDSRSFIYVTGEGMTHIPLVGSKHSLGEDKWAFKDATFGTWSRQ
jgi:hypothetical protein